MYIAEAEEDSYGKFSSTRPYCADGHEAEKYKSLKQFDVIFEKEQSKSKINNISS